MSLGFNNKRRSSKMKPHGEFNGGLKLRYLDCVVTKEPFGTPAAHFDPPGMKHTPRKKGADPDNMGERAKNIGGYSGAVDD